LRAEGFEVIPIQRLFRGHVLIPLGRLRLLNLRTKHLMGRNQALARSGQKASDAQPLCSSCHFLTTASVFSMCFSALESE
jgi:hypothetical protein